MAANWHWEMVGKSGRGVIRDGRGKGRCGKAKSRVVQVSRMGFAPALQIAVGFVMVCGRLTDTIDLNRTMSASLLGGIGILLLVIGIPVLLIAFWLIGGYNGLVKLRNRYRNAFAQIDVQLKRRHDLIPNLVETAKGFMSHERETLEAVIQARNTASKAREGVNPDDAGQMKGLIAAEAGLGSAMGKFFALSEAYPDLKSNQNMMQLSEELTNTENKVSFSRQAYNDAVTVYNTKTETIPTNFIANMFNFQRAVLFEVASEEERERVDVKFD